MVKECNKINLIRMRTPERVKKIILLRLKINEKEKKLIKKTLFTLMLASNILKLHLHLLYNTVNQIWYLAGDNSTDFNFYTKRIILASVYCRTVFYWLGSNKNLYKTEKYLDKQLKKVMQNT